MGGASTSTEVVKEKAIVREWSSAAEEHLYSDVELLFELRRAS